MNQLAGVNIQSSVGMFTMSCQSLTYAEPSDFLLLLRIFVRLYLDYLFAVSQNKMPTQSFCDNYGKYHIF